MAKVKPGTFILEGTPLTKEQIIQFFKEKVGEDKYRAKRGIDINSDWNTNYGVWERSKHSYGDRSDWAYVNICRDVFSLEPQSQEEFLAEHDPKLIERMERIAMAKERWEQILTNLLKSGSKRILLVGPPGTGKSTTAMLYTGTQWRVTMTEGTCVEELIGMYQLVDGATVWVDGPATKAMRHGEALLVDEIDHFSTELGSLMYALADDHPQIMLPTGEMVKAKDGYVFIATSNANISALPEAIIDRMEAVLIAGTPHPDAMQELEEAERAAVINHFRALDKTPWQWTGKPTLRRMAAFSKLKKSGQMDEDIIADAVFGKSGKEIVSALATSGVNPKVKVKGASK